MINISIESFKLQLNEINKIENKNIIFIIICEDALLSKGASNEEMASQVLHLHLCDTDTENTSLLVNNSNISLLFPPDTFKSSQVTFIYITLLTIQIVSKQLHNIKMGK